MERATSDRRAAPRYPACYPIELAGGSAISLDFSVSGVLFMTSDVEPSPGESVDFSVLLDDDHATDIVRLQCRGRVVRSSPRDDHFRDVAVRIESFWFESEVTH